jgi:hypothetical protein
MKNSVKNLLNLIGTLKCMRHPNQIHETQTHGSTEGKLNLGCYTPILAFHLYFHFHRHIKS